MQNYYLKRINKLHERLYTIQKTWIAIARQYEKMPNNSQGGIIGGAFRDCAREIRDALRKDKQNNYPPIHKEIP